MELFSLETILCVNHVIPNEEIIFYYLNHVSPNSDTCPEYRALHDNITSKLRVPHSGKIRRYYCGTNPARELHHTKCFEPKLLPEQTQQRVNHKRKQGKI